MSKAAQRIAGRMVDEGFWPEGLVYLPGCRLQRTYAGHWQRSQGAFSWFMRYFDATGQEVVGPELGSQFPAHVVLGWSRWLLYAGGLDMDTSCIDGKPMQ